MTRLLIVLAWRNLWRHRKRTLLTASTLALALMMLVVFLGLGDGGHVQMIESGVRMGAGHVVVQHPDYQSDGSFEDTIGASVAKQVRTELGADAIVASRVFASGC